MVQALRETRCDAGSKSFSGYDLYPTGKMMEERNGTRGLSPPRSGCGSLGRSLHLSELRHLLQ